MRNFNASRKKIPNTYWNIIISGGRLPLISRLGDAPPLWTPMQGSSGVWHRFWPSDVRLWPLCPHGSVSARQSPLNLNNWPRLKTDGTTAGRSKSFEFPRNFLRISWMIYIFGYKVLLTNTRNRWSACIGQANNTTIVGRHHGYRSSAYDFSWETSKKRNSENISSRHVVHD